MKRHGFIIISAIITFGLIVAYIIHFHDAPLSDNSSDWGAWGGYIATGISILSATLIYITYKEQQESNRIGRFEQHYHVSLQTLTELFEKREDFVSSIFPKVAEHFRNHFDPLTDYEQTKIQRMLGYYYSSAVVDTQEECDEIFRYLHTTLLYIHKETILSEQDKKRCITEISCLLSEEVRLLFLCWGCYLWIDVVKFYNSGLYHTSKLNNSSLTNVVRFACTGIRPQKETVNMENIEPEDYSSEEFQDTYERLFNNKTKRQ